MRYYIEIRLVPGSEIPFDFLWEKLFQWVHLKLVKIKGNSEKVPIGIGFPEYQSESFSLGSQLRLFAPSRDDLERFDINSGFNGFKDYVCFTEIQEVPDKIGKYCCFKRVQIKTNRACLAKRKAKRHGISYEQALVDYKDFDKKLTNIPFIYIRSQSTNKRFRFFIQRQECGSFVNEGFGSYGLSSRSTIPEF